MKPAVKKDLLALVKQNIIPKVDHRFYEGLPAETDEYKHFSSEHVYIWQNYYKRMLHEASMTMFLGVSLTCIGEFLYMSLLHSILCPCCIMEFSATQT